MSIVHLNSGNFKETVEREGVKAAVDFYADWCGPCKMFAPIFEGLSEERDDVIFAKVNVDDAEDLAVRFGVMSIPTVIIFKDGVPTSVQTGVVGKAKLSELIDG